VLDSPFNSRISWFVGTCGISDPAWVGNFYPKGFRAIDWLPYYVTRFNSIEFNTTFRVIPARNVVRRWERITPANFRVCVKFPKALTHRFQNDLSEHGAVEIAKQFFGVIQELGDKLSVVLMQFPPTFSEDHAIRLFRLLDRIQCPGHLAVEFRNDSWWKSETAVALRERNIGWVSADLADRAHVAMVPAEGRLAEFGLRSIISTTDFLYVRLLGQHGQLPVHVREYFDSTPRVAWWFERLKHVLKAYPNVRNVYVFFDNDFSGHAPTAARRLADIVHLPRFFEPPSRDGQQSLYSLELTRARNG
jgi:uncharacterized protein YecE (DUF72 family)